MQIDTNPDFEAWLKRVQRAYENKVKLLDKRSKGSPDEWVEASQAAQNLIMEFGFLNLPPALVWLHREGSQPLMPNRRQLNIRKAGLLIAGVGLTALVLQYIVFNVAEHEYGRNFVECWLGRCSQEALYEPGVWLGLLGLTGGAIIGFGQHALIGPLQQWLYSAEPAPSPQVQKANRQSRVIDGPALHTEEGLIIRTARTANGGGQLEVFENGKWIAAAQSSAKGRANMGLFFQAQYLTNDPEKMREWGYDVVTDSQVGVS